MVVLLHNGKTYGAIQKGIHLFYIQEPNKPLYLTNIAKFTSLWKLEGDHWKLSRVLSYDHKEPDTNYGSKFHVDYPTPLFHTDTKIENLLQISRKQSRKSHRSFSSLHKMPLTGEIFVAAN